MGLRRSPETSVSNHPTPRNNPAAEGIKITLDKRSWNDNLCWSNLLYCAIVERVGSSLVDRSSIFFWSRAFYVTIGSPQSVESTLPSLVELDPVTTKFNFPVRRFRIAANFLQVLVMFLVCCQRVEVGCVVNALQEDTSSAFRVKLSTVTKQMASKSPVRVSGRQPASITSTTY
jgi:hypothetical protein